ncbi:MAG: hypothetical protein MUC50_22430 [Myxococcota bacterium]|jgi:hypothetical protein|nr:hypothetical protein [Myxococcota bacterium]
MNASRATGCRIVLGGLLIVAGLASACDDGDSQSPLDTSSTDTGTDTDTDTVSDTSSEVDTETGEFFDPVAAAAMDQAFTAASEAIGAIFPQHEVSFVQVQGVPQGSASSYQQTPFKWAYTMAACDTSSGNCEDTKGVELDWPGWTTEIIDEMPMGAYLSQADFASAIPLNLEQLIAKIADSGVNPSTCPISSEGTPAGGILLRGTLSGAGVQWLWNIWCDGMQGDYYFDEQGIPLGG